jgi:hypothetical protein
MNSKSIETLNWIKGCMTTCTDIEQLKNCEVLIAMFVFRLRKEDCPDYLIRESESDLLEFYISKESLFIIPPSNF